MAFKKKELVLCVYVQDTLLNKTANRTMQLFMGDEGTLCVEFLLKNTQVTASRKGNRPSDKKSFHIIPFILFTSLNDIHV